jgi:hypothetical protein
MSKQHIVVSALLLALGIAAAGYFASQTLLNAQRGMNVVEVKRLGGAARGCGSRQLEHHLAAKQRQPCRDCEIV